jgi:hypothetical protein
METGSASEACLVTLGEGNHTPAVNQTCCSSRYVTLADGQHWGVEVTLMLAGEFEDDPGQSDPSMVPAWYSFNVYQEGAKLFGDPIRCGEDVAGC